MSDQLQQSRDPLLFDVWVVTFECPLHFIFVPLGLEGVVFVSEALSDILPLQHVGCTEIDTELWRFHFGALNFSDVDDLH